MMANESSLRIESRGQVRWLLIDRPGHANALTVDLLDELKRHIQSAAGDGVRALVITGAESRFSAGIDLAELTGTVDDLRVDEAIGETVDAICNASVPVVAAINGACYGAAVELARACDIVVADRTATFCIPATRLGLLYRPEALARLYRRLGVAARCIVVSGERFDAVAAARLGLVDVIADGPVTEVVDELASRLTDAVPEAVAATKALFADLDHDRLDLDRFETTRRSLLDSPARRQTLDEQRRRLSPNKER